MNIVILTSDDALAGMLLYPVCARFAREISSICVLNQTMYKKTNLQLFFWVARISGMRYACALAVEAVSSKIIVTLRTLLKLNREPDRVLMTPSALAKKFQIPLLRTSNILSDNVLATIRSLKPDLIVSARFSQVLKQKILSIPSLGVINFHASLLPNYGGLGSIFQALAAQDSVVGITVHQMTEKVDQGAILAQQAIPVSSRESVHRVEIRCHAKGAALLLKTVESIRTSGAFPEPLSVSRERSYFSIPEYATIQSFLKRGGAFVRLSDLFYLLFHFSYGSSNDTADAPGVS